MFTVSNCYVPLENTHYIQRKDISLWKLQPDIKVHKVICANVNANDTVWDQTANPNARGEYLVNVAMDAKSAFLNDPVQPTRQNPAKGAFTSTDGKIIHAAFRDRYDWDPIDTLSSNHRPIQIIIHLPTKKMRGENSSSGIGRKGIWLLLQKKLIKNCEEVDSMMVNPSHKSPDPFAKRCSQPPDNTSACRQWG